MASPISGLAGDNGYLPTCYADIPLQALRVSVRKNLAKYLNLEKMPNDSGIVPDFNGLAELAGFDYLEIQNFARNANPTIALLEEWTSRMDLIPVVGKLVEYLLQLEREDVLTDCINLIIKDCENFVNRRAQFKEVEPLQDQTVSQSEGPSRGAIDHHVDETVIMTIQDVKEGRPTYYDAFVCYNPEGYDLQFVKLMLKRLEDDPYNLRFFVPWRDDLPGASEHTINAKLIQDRCQRMVIIMSPKYLASSSCDFQTKFAHSLSPGSRSKKLVPVLITPCGIPHILRHVTLCDFTKNDLMEWFWERLARAISAPLDPSEVQLQGDVPLTDICLKDCIPQQQLWVESSSSSSSLSSSSSSSRTSLNVGATSSGIHASRC